jgi:RHS repeat-associated protein
MQMPGRVFSSGSYRYGFNGKENDNEVKGTGNQQDYGMRIYDPRVGRFLSVDPLTAHYPWYTPYQFAGNKPIQFIDLDGAEETLYGLAKEGAFGKKGSKIVLGTIEGIHASLSKTWSFVSNDMWKADKWKEAYFFMEESALGLSTVRVTPTPRVDAAVLDFKSNVIDGDEYSRSKYISEFGTSALTGYGAGKIAGFARVGMAKYMSGTFTIGSKTLAKVTAHLEQFGVRAENTIMLDRMKKIAKGELKATEIDLNFAKHELRESELMKSGMSYEKAHEAVLKEQNMYHRDYQKKLYTEDALKAGDEQMLREVEKGN